MIDLMEKTMLWLHDGFALFSMVLVVYYSGYIGQKEQPAYSTYVSAVYTSRVPRPVA
jgi:hypothetical protein